MILSSWVAHGHVGLSAAQPALQLLGHQVTALPTVMLSNHKAWPHCAGDAVPVADLSAMLAAIKANGWLETVTAILIGYLPSPDHVAFAAQVISAAPDAAHIVIDPVLGDDPGGLYVGEDIGRAVRETLIPRAQTLTPNRFELAWLTGMPANDLRASVRAAQTLAPATIHVTSPPLDTGQTGVLTIGNGEPTVHCHPTHANIPKGTGDVFSALIAAGQAPGTALGHLEALIKASTGLQHLALVESAPSWTMAKPISAKEPIDGI
ncbi:MAG: PfkB family carbohydrate kinase [Pseudomonadota bacterium]